MEEKFTHFIGIDISKATLDVGLIDSCKKENIITFKTSNTSKGMKDLFNWLTKQKVSIKKALFCMEHTGIYGKLPAMFILSKKGNLWLEMSLKIIRSLGIQRGKNDKLDAIRIATYAYKNREEVKLTTLPRPIIDKIRMMLGARNRLIIAKTNLQKTANEYGVINSASVKEALRLVKRSILALKNDVENIDKQLDKIINEDDQLRNMFKIAISVPGIGKITALYIICFTNEFKNYVTAKQLACYCGVVPFEHTSGSSVRKKPKVHYMANKLLKKHLHMGALAAITYDSEFKDYFNRKINEGKHKMLVINNVRNKIVLRLCAVIKRMEPYNRVA